jgi:hypothetical protein
MNQTLSPTSKTRAYYTSLIQCPASITPIPMNQRIGKRWVYARKYGNRGQKEHNHAIETLYSNILKRFKQLTPQPFTYPIFERDYRNDNRDNAFMMHAYLSNSFFFLLSCDLTCNYIIEYSFNNCPIAEEVMSLLKGYLSNNRIIEEPILDFEEFYERALRVQDKKHITY